MAGGIPATASLTDHTVYKSVLDFEYILVRTSLEKNIFSLRFKKRETLTYTNFADPSFVTANVAQPSSRFTGWALTIKTFRLLRA